MTKPQILVVDDDEQTTEVLSYLLQDGGYEVFTAGDGVEALEVLNTKPTVRLVITDVRMPNMDGKELLARIRQDARLSHIPAILICGTAKYVEELKEHVQGALVKPFDGDRLLSRLADLLRA